MLKLRKFRYYTVRIVLGITDKDHNDLVDSDWNRPVWLAISHGKGYHLLSKDPGILRRHPRIRHKIRFRGLSAGGESYVPPAHPLLATRPNPPQLW